MKRFNIYIFITLIMAFVVEFYMQPGFGAFFAIAAIPPAYLYGDPNLPPGKTAEHHPAEYIFSKITEGTVPFGVLVVQGSENYLSKIISSASDKVDGISVWSKDASGISQDQYLDGDSMGVMDTGIVSVHVEEAVQEGDPVRVRHTTEDKISGYQIISFSAAKTGTDTTGLANDSTEYTETISVNGSAQDITVIGSAAQTFATLINELNADLEGAEASIDGDGNIKIFSLIPGDESTIEIASGGNIFSTLTNFDILETSVSGSANPDPTKEAGYFLTSAEAGKTALLENAEFKGNTDGAGTVAVLIDRPLKLSADV